MSNISALRQICQSELRALDGDLYMSYIFASSKSRDQFLAFSHFYCSLFQIYTESNDPMMRLIRLQWWLELPIDSPDVPPVISLWQRSGLDETLKNELVTAHIAQIDEPKEDGLYQIGQWFFEQAAVLMSQRLITADVKDTLSQLGFKWEFWRQNGRSMTFDKMADHRAELFDLVEAFNNSPQDQRKEIRSLIVLMALNRQHVDAWPLDKSLFSYLLSSVTSAFLARI